MTETPDARREHRLERTYEVSADPEEVWRAIATADGIATWMAPTTLDPRVGGAVRFDFGDLVSTGVITDYTPGRRFAYEEPWPLAENPDELAPDMAQWFATLGIPLSEVYATRPLLSPVATEFLLEAASGGSCVLRVVTSAFGTGADWENEFFDEMAGGFVPLLDALAAQLSAQSTSAVRR